jgi:putative flippase GtrA
MVRFLGFSITALIGLILVAGGVYMLMELVLGMLMPIAGGNLITLVIASIIIIVVGLWLNRRAGSALPIQN